MLVEELILKLQALQQSHPEAPIIFVSANGANKYSCCVTSVSEAGFIVVRLQENIVKKR